MRLPPHTIGWLVDLSQVVMRLLHTKTGLFHDFEDPRETPYAILSHVWAKKDGSPSYIPELEYQTARDIQIEEEERSQGDVSQMSILSRFPQKIRSFCEIASSHGYDYAWHDACCINKTSSSELSEAINSMYDWYRYASVCYVFLHDVPTPAYGEPGAVTQLGSAFRESQWHQRGWTLQELLAPSVVVFLSANWNIIGTKHTLATLLEEITKVDREVLTGRRPLDQVSVACRMSWASPRKTSREEDEAYSLLGIFGVNMRTNYGEGGHAFIRLQQEILKQIPDQTIFAWGHVLSQRKFSFNCDALIADRTTRGPQTASKETASLDQYLLAPSPKLFKGSSNLVALPWDEFMQLFGAPPSHRPTYTITPYGVRAHLPLLSVNIDNAQTKVPTRVVLLACKDSRHNGLMVLIIRAQPQQRWDYFVARSIPQNHHVSRHYYRMARMSLDVVEKFAGKFSWEDIHVPHWPTLASYNLHRDVSLHKLLRSTATKQFEVCISPWSREVLKAHGYGITQNCGGGSTIEIANLSASDFDWETLRIYVRHCDCTFGSERSYLSANLVVGPPGQSDVCGIQSRRDHDGDHPAHIQSWTFRNGTASNEFSMDLDGKAITVRLTFAQTRRGESSYILGIEIWDNDAVEQASDPFCDLRGLGRSSSQREVRKRGPTLPPHRSKTMSGSLPSRASPKQPRLRRLPVVESEPSTPLEQPNNAHKPDPWHIPSNSHSQDTGRETSPIVHPELTSSRHASSVPSTRGTYVDSDHLPIDVLPDDREATARFGRSHPLQNSVCDSESLEHPHPRGPPAARDQSTLYHDSDDSTRQAGQRQFTASPDSVYHKDPQRSEEHRTAPQGSRSHLRGDNEVSHILHARRTLSSDIYYDNVETPNRMASYSPFVEPAPSLSSTSSPTAPVGDTPGRVEEQGRRDATWHGNPIAVSHSTGEIPGSARAMMAKFNEDPKTHKPAPRPRRSPLNFLRSFKMARSTSR
ncbi:hypothetical protein VTO73DRAFT_5099 [Trametes versicolor]